MQVEVGPCVPATRHIIKVVHECACVCVDVHAYVSVRTRMYACAPACDKHVRVVNVWIRTEVIYTFMHCVYDSMRVRAHVRVHVYIP